MAGQNKASMRRKLRSALANKSAADALLGAIAETQQKVNTALDKLDANGVTPAVAATATMNLATDIVLTSVAAGAARNTNTLTLQVEAAAANPTNTVLAVFTGTAAAIVLTITPNDGTNNSATPVNLTTAEIVQLINTGAVTGKSVTLTDASSHRVLQTATGGDATPVADGGEGDGVVGTFAGGANASANVLDTDYEADCAIASILDPDAHLSSQHHSSLRATLRSALAHRKMADEILDAIVEIQAAHNALMVKLDDEAGTLASTDFEADLAVSVMDADSEALPAQHKAKIRRSLRSALANESLADEILDAISGLEESLNEALAKLDAGTIHGQMEALKVTEIQPDAEG